MGDSVDMHVAGYHLTECIGAGGMGSVFRATVEDEGKSLPAGSTVAIRLLSPPLWTIPEFAKRFKDEACLAGRIEHPNVARLLETGEANGKHYIAMEYAEGVKLSELMVDKHPLSWPLTVEIMKQTCQALDAAASIFHAGQEHCLVNRDIRPRNIFVQMPGGNQGEKGAPNALLVKVLDFGLAKGVTGLSTVLWQAESSLDEPAYMSPEQFRTAEVDQRSDIYSLGVCAYTMITGATPFRGPTREAYAKQHAAEVPLGIVKQNPLCPRNLADCIDRCLAKNPKGRYQSPDELLRDLERVRAGKRVKPISRKRVVAFIGAGILTGLLAVGATWFFTLNRAEAGLAQAIQKADVAVASQDYLAAKKSLEDAIAAVPNWLPNKSGLVAPAYSKLQTFAAGAREQQASIDKAEAKRKEAAALAAYKKHDQDAITVIASIKAKTAAGDYRQAIAAANAAIKDFSDTPSGKELPDLLAAATKELRAVQEAEEARQAAEAKARDERFVKYRDEGDALLATGQFEQAQLSYENALKEKTDTVVRTRLERCIKAQAEAKLKHNHAAQAAVADIKTKIAAGQYQQAIAAANEAIKFFEDTSIGMELPDLLADATGKLKGAQEAQRQDALARKKDCDSAAQAAQAAGAQTFARDFWDLAEASAGAAQYSFDQGDFPQATELWKKAAGGYEEASVETKRFQRDRTLDLGNKVTMKLAIIPPGKFRAPRCLVWVDSWTLAGSS